MLRLLQLVEDTNVRVCRVFKPADFSNQVAYLILALVVDSIRHDTEWFWILQVCGEQ